ncbi:uncharacterized protein PHACADRAFT_249920 [Phanerochaete carnosa HHB-10118-sp]|uniref:MBOAT-domain-containing protein n=1 Tax=Phanerochaete carnosa (strain HHB-10118-sp) TaxID=650164 RepID=K5W690_PHACS|nr:uncharacterized protein PHACADRAFT_249920 [Phanerochaete carnosa HHB-10118-sp]EKM59433.1 hypothetical protein PHACADRAFT_249920 [Phanerochaete carnosa HHB-10118-sp]
MDAVFRPLAEAVGASLDQIKHIFNIAVTLFYLLPVLNLWFGFLQLLADVIATYYIALNVKGKNMPWIVFAVTMGHLTVNHAIRALWDLSYETVEVTGPQMVLVMKLTTFAWNVYDGRRPAEELDKWQTEKRVVQHPSLLTFLGYSFYFPGLLVGPYLEFADYMDLIDGTRFKLLEKADDKQFKAVSIPGRLVPRGRKRVAYRKMIMGLIYLGLFVVLGGQYNFGIAVQDWFAQKSLLYRIAIFQVCGVVERIKYYAIWTLTEGAAILTGLGFTGFGPRGETRWEGAANVKVTMIEFAPNMKVLLDSWNMKTNVWLRECIYKRVTPKGKKPGFRSSMITFATSAFWHGVAGGYYLSFLFGGFMQTVGRLCRSHIRPLFLPATYVEVRGGPPPPHTPLKRVYDIVGTLSCILILNYIAAPFMLLTWHDSLLGWSRLAWYGHGIIFGAMAFFYGGGIKMLKGIQAGRVKKSGMAQELKEVPSGLSTGTATPSIQTLPPLDAVAKEVEKSEFMRNLST